MNGKTLACLVGLLVCFVEANRACAAGLVFGTPVNLGPSFNSGFNNASPSISSDSLSLFFHARPDESTPHDIYVSTRPSLSDPFGAPAKLPAVNTPWGERTPDIAADGLSLYLTSDDPNGVGEQDLWVASRASTSDPFGSRVNLGFLNSPETDTAPSISADGLTLVFASRRDGGYGERDMWIATRPTVSAPFGNPVNLGSGVNTEYPDTAPDVSPDGLTFVLCVQASSFRMEGLI